MNPFDCFRPNFESYLRWETWDSFLAACLSFDLTRDGYEAIRKDKEDWGMNYCDGYHLITLMPELQEQIDRTIFSEQNSRSAKQLLNAKNAQFTPDAYIRWARAKNVTLPDRLLALLGPGSVGADESVKASVENLHADRIRAQTVAEVLWHGNPNLTIKELAGDERMSAIAHKDLRLKSGDPTACYEPRKIGEWISEVDPRPSDERRGPKPKK